MPFIRHTRDRRGYETTYLMHSYRPGSGSGRTRVLYLFRSPANVKVGRRALDEESREALEHTHPDLSFDWFGIGRDLAAPRDTSQPERHERVGRDDRRDRRDERRPAPPAPSPQTTPVVPLIIDDQSLLGRTLGASDALRLRTRYQELLQRIARRSRTPEDRDRLLDQLQRLNPDDWADETAIRATAPAVEAEWAAIALELPARRRGRRGGRRDVRGPEPDATGSAIIGGNEEADARTDDPDAGGADRAAGAPGDDPGSTTEPGPERPAGHDLPGDDELRHD